MLGREAGENGMEGPPVPIPNTEVKLHRAEDTWWATARENRSLPAQKRSRYGVYLLLFCVFNGTMKRNLVFTI